MPSSRYSFCRSAYQTTEPGASARSPAFSPTGPCPSSAPPATASGATCSAENNSAWRGLRAGSSFTRPPIALGIHQHAQSIPDHLLDTRGRNYTDGTTAREFSLWRGHGQQLTYSFVL